MKLQIFSFFVILSALSVIQEVKTFPHEHTGILNIDVASEFFYTELKRLFKVIQDPIFKRLGDLLYHHEVDNVRDILTVFASPMTTPESKVTVDKEITTTARAISKPPTEDESREENEEDENKEQEDRENSGEE